MRQEANAARWRGPCDVVESSRKRSVPVARVQRVCPSSRRLSEDAKIKQPTNLTLGFYAPVSNPCQRPTLDSPIKPCDARAAIGHISSLSLFFAVAVETCTGPGPDLDPDLDRIWTRLRPDLDWTCAGPGPDLDLDRIWTRRRPDLHQT